MNVNNWVIASLNGFDAGASLDRFDKKALLGLTSAEGILSAVEDRMPDFLAVDFIVPGSDSATLVKSIRRLSIAMMPVVAVLVPDGLMELASEVLEGSGVFALLKKPVTGDDLIETAMRATVRDRLPRYGVNRLTITKLLWYLGFNPANSGCEYALAAIDLVSRDMRLAGDMSKTLCPAIAEMYSDDADHVADAMRRAAEAAWSSGSPDRMYGLFGNSIDARRAKPTLSELFSCVAQRLHSGMEIDI